MGGGEGYVPLRRPSGWCKALSWRRRRAAPYDQFRVQWRRTVRRAVLQIANDVSGYLFAHPSARYPDRRQRRIEMRRHVGVVEADDAQVPGNRQVELLRLDHGARCDVVVCANQGGGAQSSVRENPAHAIPAAGNMPAVHPGKMLRTYGDAATPQRVLHAGNALLDPVVALAFVRDHAEVEMPQREHML